MEKLAACHNSRIKDRCGCALKQRTGEAQKREVSVLTTTAC
ncbi:hypothetical protein LCGC14_1188160 [marine sediment metagenome]|uniref:Uncharacterized protein n=1 Tax=marine sediment metagenome TaxID=412755 RepID=A0A0F9P2Y5_9ZZZZ